MVEQSALPSLDLALYQPELNIAYRDTPYTYQSLINPPNPEENRGYFVRRVPVSGTECVYLDKTTEILDFDRHGMIVSSDDPTSVLRVNLSTTEVIITNVENLKISDVIVKTDGDISPFLISKYGEDLDPPMVSDWFFDRMKQNGLVEGWRDHFYVVYRADIGISINRGNCVRGNRNDQNYPKPDGSWTKPEMSRLRYHLWGNVQNNSFLNFGNIIVHLVIFPPKEPIPLFEAKNEPVEVIVSFQEERLGSGFVEKERLRIMSKTFRDMTDDCSHNISVFPVVLLHDPRSEKINLEDMVALFIYTLNLGRQSEREVETDLYNDIPEGYKHDIALRKWVFMLHEYAGSQYEYFFFPHCEAYDSPPGDMGYLYQYLALLYSSSITPGIQESMEENPQKIPMFIVEHYSYPIPNVSDTTRSIINAYYENIYLEPLMEKIKENPSFYINKKVPILTIWRLFDHCERLLKIFMEDGIENPLLFLNNHKSPEDLLDLFEEIHLKFPCIVTLLALSITAQTKRDQTEFIRFFLDRYPFRDNLIRRAKEEKLPCEIIGMIKVL